MGYPSGGPKEIPSQPEYTVESYLGVMLDSTNVIHRLPLPKEVPMAFRVLPEYIIEDVADYILFSVQYVTGRQSLHGVDIFTGTRPKSGRWPEEQSSWHLS